MKYVHRIVLATSLSWCVVPAMVSAQTAVPQEIRSASALTPEQEQLVSTLVTQNFAKLQGTDVAAQQQARDAIVRDAQGGAVYGGKYAQAVGEAATAALAPAKPMRVRLNAAVAAARVAEVTKSTRLEGVAQVMLDDKHPVIQLWGLKTTRAILPELMKINAHQKLMGRIATTVQQYPSGPMTGEAYEALKILDKAATEELLKVIAARVAVYQKGLPEDPAVDVIPFVHLSAGTTWLSAVQEASRPKVLELACQILVLGAYHGDAQGQGTAEREQLQSLMKTTLSSLAVIAKHLGNTELDKAATDALKKVGVAGANLSEAVKPIPVVVKKIKGCERIEVPALTPPPSTQPVTLTK